MSFTSSCSSATILQHGNHSDHSALLAFKSSIVFGKDPIGALSSWTDTLHHCDWQGIICSRRHPDRVTVLNLTSLQLEGTLSPFIGNLSFLRRIDLSLNKFHGQIPHEIGRLSRLQFLALQDNFFHGGIPTSLTHCSLLKLVNLNSNNLTGNILSELSSLSQLESLFLSANNLIGSIPSSFGNLSSLRGLSLGSNLLEGRIPTDLCHIRNLEFIQLFDNKLIGELPPCIYNLSSLIYLLVANNQLEGNIPPNIGHTLPRLQDIRVQSNRFSGPIPLSSLCYATRLEIVSFSKNSFSGEIPSNLSHCSNLVDIRLDHNMLSGNIPTSFGNLSSLTQLRLSFNQLEGGIPDDLCRITTITFFQVVSNKLTGHVPSCLYNLSNMEYFEVSDNRLDGNVPCNMGLTLSKIKTIYLTGNKFIGHIPISLSNATTLESFDFGQNHFTSPVPKHLGRLKSLRYIGFEGNNLGTQDGDDLEFITSLSNCTSLEEIGISFNILRGPLPVSLSNLSTTLISLTARYNLLYGSIPNGIGKLINMQRLFLDNNYLTGDIPQSIGKLNKLSQIYLGKNRLSGRVPTYLSNLTQLTRLSIGRNTISGIIPSSLGNCQKLEYLDFSHNHLVGKIPNQLTFLSLLTIGLYLNHNFLSDSLPSQIGNMSKLMILDVAENKLSGHIPKSIGDCLNLVRLSMAGNFFEAEIPKSLNALKGLQDLDLSRNNFSGNIPKYLDKLPLINLNLSFNKFQGPIPISGVFANANAISIVGNKDVCGGVTMLKLPPCISKKKNSSTAIWVIIFTIGGSLFLLSFLYFMMKYFRRKILIRKPSWGTVFDQPYKRTSYSELLKATNQFSTENLIGVGSYGSVFKGIIQDQIVAVKVLSLEREGASNSFLRECNALRNLRHRNLVKVITTCSSVDFKGNDFKAIVLELMSNGSLNDWLHPRVDEEHISSRDLNFVQRISILVDVASALEYLHHQQTPTIVHCDLKPSNILLDDDMTAHVADFGLAKIFSSTTSNDSGQSFANSLLVRGSIGYVAPEYGVGSEASTKGDVYSYGILLLEIFTRKKPTDYSSLKGLSLHDYSKEAITHQVIDIVDPMLLVQENIDLLDIVGQNNTRSRLQECLVLIIKLGVRCSLQSPTERMTMTEVVNELHHIEDHYQGVRDFQVCLD